MNFLKLFTLLIITCLISCQSQPKKLPNYSMTVSETGDTSWTRIPDFEFINQDSISITNTTFSDKIYVADFFFTNCPSICPKVTKQMLRIHDRYLDDPRVALVAHTMDPVRDTIPKLKSYANKLEIDHNKWHFVTGEKEALHDIAEDYWITVIEDKTVPGGFDHSGKIILIDHQGQIRSFGEGTDEDDITRLMKDIDLLLLEYE